MLFAPDSPCVTQVRPSPNHDQRAAGQKTDILMLHYTGMANTAIAIDRLCEAAAKVSSHYVVDEQGNVLQLVPEERRAWHAGLSVWAGATDLNSRSIGIEIGNCGHSYGYPDFPEPQVAAVIGLCQDIVTRFGIRPHHVLAHSDVAPLRKIDPGEKFPWRRLHQAGIGLWVPPAPDRSGEVLVAGNRGEAVAELQQALRAYGYGVDLTGIYDELTVAVVTGFQRHFRPSRVDGEADPATRATLRALLAARDTVPA